ncbi:MAG: DUF4422 domain-containing protein [Bifidobacterium sp.]|jgi:hypothetical protein|nr:DUF4422 domain-containing protein [Bifidobacterium sp.]
MGRPVTVAVVSHKPYRMPQDPMYMPLHVGAALHPEVLPDWVQDNTGDNISSRNAKYSELTGLYWLWKNDDSDYQGIVHYRRHFGTANRALRLMTRDRFRCIIGEQELSRILEGCDIVLPHRRNYFVETIYSHYAHTFLSAQLDTTRDIIAEQFAEYLPAFDVVMKSKSAHIFNMFVMSRQKLDEYCSWLFPILEELENYTEDGEYDDFNARYPGRISERLMDVWLITRGYAYSELPVISPEPVNWIKKGSGFLMAKFGGKKYTKSF